MDKPAIDALLQAINRPASYMYDPEHHVVLAPPGYSPHDISKYLPPPDRVRQKVEVLTAQDFIDYVDRFARNDRTVIFADEAKATYESVLDYHGEESSAAGTDTLAAPKDNTPRVYRERGFCEHVVNYACPHSDQWKLWKAGSGKPTEQVTFAKFIEDNILDITAPPAGAFLQCVLQFEIHKAAKFMSEERLDNGQRRFRYEEEVRGTAGVGNIDIPQTFRIKVPVFFEGALVEVECRFRYRMEAGRLSVWYELVRWQDVEMAAVRAVSTAIREAVGEEVPFYRGRRVGH